MYKKITLVSLMMILLVSLVFTGCTLDKTDYHIEYEPEDLKELPPVGYSGEELSSFIKTKDNIYGLIMGLDFVIAILAIFYIFKFLLIENNLKSEQRFIMIFINTLALGMAIISFDAVHFSGWFIHRYEKVLIPTWEILIYDVVAVVILVISGIVYKVLRKRNAEDGEKLLEEKGHSKWKDFWGK